MSGGMSASLIDGNGDELVLATFPCFLRPYRGFCFISQFSHNERFISLRHLFGNKITLVCLPAGRTDERRASCVSIKICKMGGLGVVKISTKEYGQSESYQQNACESAYTRMVPFPLPLASSGNHIRLCMARHIKLGVDHRAR